jgi:hypothetical protein
MNEEEEMVVAVVGFFVLNDAIHLRERASARAEGMFCMDVYVSATSDTEYLKREKERENFI